MRILVVDDDLVSRTKLQAAFECLGQCDMAANGAQGVESFMLAWESMKPYDLICLDIEMPEMDGRKALRLIRKTEERWALPHQAKATIFIITAQSDKNRVQDFIDAGCNDFIVKPFDPDFLLGKLSHYFDFIAKQPENTGV